MVSGRRTRKAASTVRPPDMYRAAERRADDSAMGEVDRIFTDELGWMFTRNQVREYGMESFPAALRGTPPSAVRGLERARTSTFKNRGLPRSTR